MDDSEEIIRELLKLNITKENINDYGRFGALKATVVKEQAQEYFTAVEGKKMPMFRVNNRVDSILTQILAGRWNGYSGAGKLEERICKGVRALHQCEKTGGLSYAR